jgi:hypothetical protein
MCAFTAVPQRFSLLLLVLMHPSKHSGNNTYVLPTQQVNLRVVSCDLYRVFHEGRLIFRDAIISIIVRKRLSFEHEQR